MIKKLWPMLCCSLLFCCCSDDSSQNATNDTDNTQISDDTVTPDDTEKTPKSNGEACTGPDECQSKYCDETSHQCANRPDNSCSTNQHPYNQGCEADDMDNCGRHDHPCRAEDFEHAETVACTAGQCAITTCVTDYHLNTNGTCVTCTQGTDWNESSHSCEEVEEPFDCAALVKNLKVKNKITFGRYMKTEDPTDLQPLQWKVYRVDNDGVLIMTTYIIDGQPYHDYQNSEIYPVTWEKSTLRSWLNGFGAESNLSHIDYTQNNFMKMAFTKGEMQCIKTVTNHNAIEETDTEDRVFMMSRDDARITDFFDHYSKRTAYVTDYAKTTGIYVKDRYCETSTGFCPGSWYLRSIHPKCVNTNTCGCDVSCDVCKACIYGDSVDEYGHFLDDGLYGVGAKRGIRPVVVLKK